MNADLLKAAIRGSVPGRRDPLAPGDMEWAADVLLEVNLLRQTHNVTLPALAEAIGYSANTLQPVLTGRRIPGRGLVVSLERWLTGYNRPTSGGDDGADKWAAIALLESDSLLNLIGGGDD